MREYEFVVKAIEEDFCDQLTALICYESYRVEPHEDGYRRLFDKYGELYNLFRDGCTDCEDIDSLLDEYHVKWKCNCDDRLNRMLKDLKKATGVTESDIDGFRETFLRKLDKEDVQTPEKRVYIYPFLITKVRELHSKKEVEVNDN